MPSTCSRSTPPRAWSGRSWWLPVWRRAWSRTPRPPTEAARAEEVRLLYVALSRAEEGLHVTWARARGTGARRERRPSPLLATILAGAEPDPPAPPPVALVPEPPAPAPVDPVLVALQRWRSSTALAADLPEETVCTDADLAALVAVRPRNEQELAEVLGPLAARRLGPRVLPLLARRRTG